MPLSSIHFFFFFSAAFLLYFAVPHRHRWLVLLFANVYFYLTWTPWFIFFIIPSVIVNYLISEEIRKALPGPGAGRYLKLGLTLNLLVLFFFKYVPFLAGEFSAVLSGWGWLDVLVDFHIGSPIGISFYTLQVIAFLLDTYRGGQKHANSLPKFALFTTFFPLQISGPIERASNLLPQFDANAGFCYEDAKEGLKRIAWGIFKKIVIADRLAIYVNQVFDNPDGYLGFPVLLAVIFFAFQLYCDFSGYTDIVLGAAKILGFRLTENFSRPYFADSVQKFWNSWHISLSTWLRDYIFYPLRRNMLRRKSLPEWTVQLLPPFVTMLVSGIWHGANWTFLLWGGLHGIYLVVETSLRPKVDAFFRKFRSGSFMNLYTAVNVILTFILVSFGWVFFRVNSMGDAFTLLVNMGQWDFPHYQNALLDGNLDEFLSPFIFDGGLNKENLLLSVGLIVFLLVAEWLTGRLDVNARFDKFPALLRWTFYLAVVFGILFFSTDSSTQNFIYFQF